MVGVDVAAPPYPSWFQSGFTSPNRSNSSKKGRLRQLRNGFAKPIQSTSGRFLIGLVAGPSDHCPSRMMVQRSPQARKRVGPEMANLSPIPCSNQGAQIFARIPETPTCKLTQLWHGVPKESVMELLPQKRRVSSKPQKESFL